MNRLSTIPGIAILAVTLLAIWAPASPLAAQVSGSIELELFVDTPPRPVALTHAGDGSGRLFIVLQDGRILVHRGGAGLATFLDISTRVSCCGERGLLGLAFHPEYRSNGFFFVNYTDTAGDTRIARFSVSADPDVADSDSETEVLSYSQPFSNHNAGDLAFGPNGYLYIASGDGGSSGDPENNAQSLDTRLGKILRIDVDGLPFAIPPDNPFVDNASALDEIWSFGLRNPWRISFDRLTGDLFIGDVGQGAREEIDFQPASSGGGENYGWRRMEGNACFDPASNCNDGSLVLPILEYSHGSGCSVTGGYRYRGAATPGLEGIYFFGDFCSGRIWGARQGTGGSWSMVELLDTDLELSSFGEDESGELYVLDLSGSVYRLRGRLIFADGFESGDTESWRAKGTQLEVVEPGLNGTRFALAVRTEPASGRSFVQAREPAGENSLRVDFFLAANRVELGGGEVDFLVLAGGRRHVKLALEQTGSRYRVKLYARGNNGPFELVGETRVPRRRSIRLGIEWARASTANGADGFVRLFKKNRVRVEATGLDNGDLRVNDLEAGLPHGAPAAGSGFFLLDEFLVKP